MSLFFAAQAVTTLQWSRLSDKVGRKPVLLSGLLGTTVASILFGLSHSFPALVFRCVRLGSDSEELLVHSNWVRPAVVCMVSLTGTPAS